MRLLLVICCLFQVLSNVFAQSKNVRFYDHSEGLESKWLGTIKTDSSGEIWMVNNDDLIRYNGYEKKVISLKQSDNKPVYVNSFAIGDPQIWIGTQERLIHYNRITLEQQTTLEASVYAMHLDDDGILWAESGKGLISVSQEQEITFLQDSSEWGSLEVFDFQNDGNGTVWIATENRGLMTYDIANEKFQEVEGLTNVNGEPQLKMRDLLLDRDGSIWAGSSGGGLFHLQNDNILQYLPSKKSGSISTTEAYALEQDAAGNLWIGTWAGGLNFYDVKTTKFTHYKAGEDNDKGLPSNVVVDLHITGDQLWLGTAYSGIWMTSLSDQSFTWWNTESSSVSLDHDNFWSILKDKSNNLWLGTYQGGLYRVSSEGKSKHYKPFIDLPANTVWSLFENRSGLWIGTHRGLLLKPDGKEELTFFSTSSNTPDGWEANNVFMIEGNDDFLYLGLWGAGVYEYSIAENKVRQILEDTNLSDLELTRAGTLWIASSTEIFTYDLTRDTVARQIEGPLLAPRPTTLFEASDGLWLANKEGLYHLVDETFKRLDHELLWEVYNPIEAPDSTLWVSTAAGMVTISKDRTDVTLVPEQNRVISTSPNARAVTHTADGRLYFGGVSGIISFRPEDVKLDEPLPETLVNAFNIGNKRMMFHEGKASEHTSFFNLTHKDLVFSFDFSAINYTHPDEITYAYQLSGLSDEWILTSATNRKASFAGLSPGQYQFHVKARSPGSDWGPTKTLNINMAPPWWKTNIAFSLYLLSACLIILSIHHMRLQGLRRNEKRLKFEIARQTQRLQENNEELAVKNKELKSLSKFKEGLTHMIVHDMKNPLNAVIGLTEGKPSKDNMGQIRQSGQTILQMITNMLDIQKFEEVDIHVEADAINLYKLAVSASREVNMLLETRGIVFKNNIDQDIMVFIDLNIILRVFVNLFTNAIKYSPSGSTITVNANIIEDRVLVDVSDKGMGISKEAIPNIFNKFWQYKARKSGEISSTGLGLTYSKLAIESHKGKISVTSELNSGSTFHFDLPYHGKSGEFFSDEDVQHQQEYSDLAKRKIQALSVMIKDIPIYNVGKITQVLKEDEPNEELSEVEKWKSSVLDATYHHDQQRFEALTSI